MRLLNFFNAMAIFLMTVIKDSLCANFECQHGAKCKIVNKRPKCECYPAWGGRHCEQLLVQPVATSTETEDTTSSSVLPRIWTETITENSVEVRIKNDQFRAKWPIPANFINFGQNNRIEPKSPISAKITAKPTLTSHPRK